MVLEYLNTFLLQLIISQNLSLSASMSLCTSFLTRWMLSSFNFHLSVCYRGY